MSEEENIKKSGDFEYNEEEEAFSSHKVTDDHEVSDTELSSSQKFETISQSTEEFIVVPVEDGNDVIASEVEIPSSPLAQSHPNQGWFVMFTRHTLHFFYCFSIENNVCFPNKMY